MSFEVRDSSTLNDEFRPMALMPLRVRRECIQRRCRLGQGGMYAWRIGAAGGQRREEFPQQRRVCRQCQQ